MYLPTKWDPRSILELENEQKCNRITCTGHARSRRGRCQREIAGSKVTSFLNILNRLAAEKSPLKAAFSDELRQAAFISLCWQHTEDLGEIIGKWQDRLFELAVKNRLAKPRWKSAGGTTPVKREGRTGYPPQRRPVKVEDPELDVSGSESSDAPEYEYDSDDSDKRSDDSGDEDAEYTKEDLRRQRERQQRERAARERQRKEAERREREKMERERKEAERKEREKKEAKAREAREWAERIREKAKKRAEEEARLAKNEWSSVWKTYSEGWDRVMKMQPDVVRIDMIPWPVRSGRWEDVNTANVKEFFAKALPVPETPEAAEIRFKHISLENKRWHTDKIMLRFGEASVSGRYKEALILIARELVLLRNEANEEKRK